MVVPTRSSLLVPFSLSPTAAAARVNLSTRAGMKLRDAFVSYGGYIVDDTADNSFCLCMESGSDAAFKSAYGYELNAKPLGTRPSPFYDDLVAIFQALQIVSNNGPGAATGGGGDPIAPRPPPLCPQMAPPVAGAAVHRTRP